MKRRSTIGGSALISAMFLVIVLLALGASMASLSTVEQDTSTKSILAARAYYGAKTGLDWGIQRVISDPAPPARCTSFAGGSTFSPAGTGLTGVSVTVTCSSAQFGVGTTTYTYYLQSTATVGTSASSFNYAERRMQATVTNIP